MAEGDVHLSEGLLSGQHKPSLDDLPQKCSTVSRGVAYGTLTVGILASFYVARLFPTRPTLSPSYHESGHQLSIPIAEQRNWAQYSPYNPTATYTGPPRGCRVTQVSKQAESKMDTDVEPLGQYCE